MSDYFKSLAKSTPYPFRDVILRCIDEILSRKPFRVFCVGEYALSNRVSVDLKVHLPCQQVILIQSNLDCQNVQGYRKGVYCDMGAHPYMREYMKLAEFDQISIDEAEKLLALMGDLQGLNYY